VTDLLTIEPHSPTPEPVKYNKEDGQWYTHDGVDVKDTQQRKGEFNDSEKLTILLVHVLYSVLLKQQCPAKIAIYMAVLGMRAMLVINWIFYDKKNLSI